MTYTQIQSRDIPWIFFKRKSTVEKGSNADEFFQVPIEALLNVDNVAEFESEKRDCAKIHSDSLICFLNQLQFIRYKERNHKISAQRACTNTNIDVAIAKVGCLFPMVVVSILPHREIRTK